MQARKANELPIQTLLWQSIVIALNIRGMLWKLGRGGHYACLNAEEGSLIREEGLPLAGCLSLIGKCKAQGRRTRCLARPILASIKSQRGWKREGKDGKKQELTLPHTPGELKPPWRLK